MKATWHSAWPGGRSLLQIFFALRGLMLIASAGAMLGAGLIFWSGGLNLYHAYESPQGSSAHPKAGN
jgi:hypothetical protein